MPIYRNLQLNIKQNTSSMYKRSWISNFLSFIEAKKWSASEVQGDDSSNWYDGFSVFCVNKEGLIYHHVADYRMPDEEKLHRRDNDNFAAKMALLLGLVPRPAAGHGNAMGDIPPLYWSYYHHLALLFIVAIELQI